MKNKLIRQKLIKQALFLLFAATATAIIIYMQPKQRSAQTIVSTEEATEAKVSTPTLTTKQASIIPKSIPILMYHHIRNYNNDGDPIGENLSVAPETLADQLDYLKSIGYTPITFHDLEGKALPEKPIIITFDDGYDNFYTNAVPLLIDRKMRAVVYVIANKTNTNGYMTETQIKSTSDAEIEIGSHTLTHPDLTKINPEKASAELSESKTKIESITGKNTSSFCYPAGKFNQEIEQIVRNSGYKYATTTQQGMADFSANTLTLKRYRINKDTNIKNIIR